MAAIASQDIVEGIASDAEVQVAGEGEVFHVGGKGIGHATVNRIRTLIWAFGHGIERIIDHKGVIPRTADHGTGRAKDNGPLGNGGLVPDRAIGKGNLLHQEVIADRDAVEQGGFHKMVQHGELGWLSSMLRIRSFPWRCKLTAPGATSAARVIVSILPAVASLSSIAVGASVAPEAVRIVAGAAVERIVTAATV